MLKRHALSAAYPTMDAAGLQALADDIREHGLRDAVALLGGLVLDGWNRTQACAMAGVELETYEWKGDDPVAFVKSKNEHRRQLTESQRAIAVVKLSDWRTAGGNGSNQHVKSSRAPVPDSAPQTNAQLAEAAHVSERTIKNAITAKAAAAIAKGYKSERTAAAGEGGEKPAAMTQADKLQIENDELRERISEMADDLKAYMTIEQGGPAVDVEIKSLQGQLRTANSQRDGYMVKCNELIKEVKSLRRRLGEKA